MNTSWIINLKLFLVQLRLCSTTQGPTVASLDNAGEEGAGQGGGDEVEEDLGVGGGVKDGAVGLQVVVEGNVVHEIAIVGDGELAKAVAGNEGLDVEQGGEGAGGGVADVADCSGAWEGVELGWGEDLGDEAEAGDNAEGGGVEGGDAGTLLATVLESVEGKATHPQWYHFTAIVIAGMGFFTDAYDLFYISLVTKLLGRLYYHVDGSPTPGSLPPNVSATINGVAFCGTLSGQLFFCWLDDKMGCKCVYGITLLLMVLCSIASGLSFASKPKSVMAALCFFRVWLGFGIDGDYPLSTTIMSEYANKKTRGTFIAAVFAM